MRVWGYSNNSLISYNRHRNRSYWEDTWYINDFTHDSEAPTRARAYVTAGEAEVFAVPLDWGVFATPLSKLLLVARYS